MGLTGCVPKEHSYQNGLKTLADVSLKKTDTDGKRHT